MRSRLLSRLVFRLKRQRLSQPDAQSISKLMPVGGTSEYMSLLIIAYHLALRALDHFSRARQPRFPRGTVQPALRRRASHAVS